MSLDFLWRVFDESAAKTAVVCRDAIVSYAELAGMCHVAGLELDRAGVKAGHIVALQADYRVQAIAMFLALARKRCIVVQAGLPPSSRLSGLLAVAQAEWMVTVATDGGYTLSITGTAASHELYDQLRSKGHPGLVLFSSGTTGVSKAIVHDLEGFATEYERRRHDLRTLAFLLFDHVGGIDTLLYCLSNGSALVLAEQRDPDSVCALVEQHRVEVLPVAPTFLNLLYFSKAYQRYDLSSLKYVTYGAEMMPEATLRACTEMFPAAQLVQKYGTSEIGTPRSKSKASDSLWLKLGGEGFDWRVVNGILHIKASGAMLGYLNAPSPFTLDGWFVTGDCVEVDGEYIRFLGRDSDIVNVGGNKVYPAEVEAVLKELPSVVDATVRGEPNALLGQVVTATVWAAPGTDRSELRRTIKEHAAGRLAPFKIPMRIEVADDLSIATDRFKKART